MNQKDNNSLICNDKKNKEKGKLTIFFGYSAGVGKTYNMLKKAHELKNEGVDVVIGYIEPHDRKDTLKLVEGLEVINTLDITYKGITLHEVNVEAIIKRKPDIVLVDELAHTNVPGSKNRKRYLDVIELLNNGINVFTTVNVQHLEGLHDMVDSATSVDVNERIPDNIFDMADEVVLIDIEPTSLIDRMKDGKIYKKAAIPTALTNFFTAEKLSHLREIFMRRSAERVEKQKNNGRLSTKVLVLISPSPSSEKSIRVASRTAEAFHCKYSAMYVETSGELNEENARNLKKNMKLVQDTGGQQIIKYSDNIVETVVSYVKLSGVTHLIIGKTWNSLKKRSIVSLEDKFIQALPNIELLIVPDMMNSSDVKRRCPLKTFFKNIFKINKKIEIYKTSNKIVDIVNLISNYAMDVNDENPIEKQVAKVLSRAFERSCIVISDDVECKISYNRDDLSIFDNESERAVLQWAQTNIRQAGKGTDTLRSSNGIYLPLKTKHGVTTIIFNCKDSKLSLTDRLVYNQLTNFLKVIL